MKKYQINNILFRGLCIAMLTVGLASCVDDYFRQYNENASYDGEEVTMPISLSVAPIESVNPETRAKIYLDADTNETKIHDLWVIEYNENGMRAGLPRYYKVTDLNDLNINIIVPRREQDKYTCVLIANSNDSLLFSKDNTARYINLDSLRNFDLRTHNHEHVFDPNNDKYLLMSGWNTVTKETTNLEFKLIRNVCKVNVKLSVFNDTALVYKYFQWRDVPLGKAFPHGYTEYHQIVSRDWKQHLDEDPDEHQKFENLQKGIDFYIPCNVWLPEGPTMPGKNLDKSDVNEDATHFVVVARENLGDEEETIEGGEQYEFCLYPSKDKENQFDFEPNHFYQLEMEINDLPAEKADHEFINLIDYHYLPESNCYMMRRDSKELFAVPLTRINRYWREFGEGESELLNDYDSITGGEATEWVAEVIWQDTPERIFEFTSFRRFQVAPDKSRLEAIGKTYFTRDGETIENYDEEEDEYKVPYAWDEEGNEFENLPMCFAFRTTGSGEGNVIVGVRKKVPGWEDIPVEEREYLWSWHIWITDYDPLAYSHNTAWIHQDVPGGQVQRFPDSKENNDWSCVMDRNLGATRTIRTREEAEAFNNDVSNGNWESRIDDAIKMFGLYYQYGRKDPFPYPNQPVYDIKGNPIAAFSKVPNMIISGPHEAVRKGASEGVRRRAIHRKATRSYDNNKNIYTGYDPYPVRLSIKYPYKFYACASGVKMGEVEAWIPEDGEEKLEWLKLNTSWTGDMTGMRNWMSPGIETYSGKSLFDPCPVGWVMPEANSFFGETSTDTEVDHLKADLEAIYSQTGGVAQYYTATLLLYGKANKYEFAYFPATGSRDGTNGKGLEGPVIQLEGYEGPEVPPLTEEDKRNIWRVGIKTDPKESTKFVTIGLTNYLWTFLRYGVSMDAPAAHFGVEKEPSLGVPIRCIREDPMD